MKGKKPWLRFVEGTEGGAASSSAGTGSSGSSSSNEGSNNDGAGNDSDRASDNEPKFTQDDLNKHLAAEKRRQQERYSDYDQIKTERDELLEKTRTEQEKAVAEAQKAAREEATAQARAGLLPQLQRTQAENIALRAGVGTADQVSAWLNTADLSRFADDSGDVKETDLMAALTAMFGGRAPQYEGMPGSGDQGGQSAWDSGVAEARRRHPQNNT